MRNSFLLFVFFFSVISLYAQKDTGLTYLDSKENPCNQQTAVKFSIQHAENGRWKKEVFDNYDDKIQYITYYKDRSCTVMEGPYRTYYKNLNIQTAGQYANNKKTGIWRTWNEDMKLIDSALYFEGFIQGIELGWDNNGTVTDSSIFGENGNGEKRGYWSNRVRKEAGNFVAGKKEGLWTYYYTSGIKCQEVNYKADSAISYTCFDEQGNLQSKDCYYEKEASFKGGDKGWTSWLGRQIMSASMPQAYMDGLIYGTVIIDFVVSPNGDVTNVRVEKSIAAQLDVIAISIIRQSPRWEPAVQYNRKVKAYRRQPLTFSKPVEQ